MVKRFKGNKKETFKRILEIVSLSNFKSRIFVFLLVLFFLFLIPVSFLESFPNLSICSNLLGSYCYSSGITRGIASLLKGNLSQALNYNPLSIPVLIAIVSIIISDFLKLRKR